MIEVISTLADTPLPTLLVGAGIFFIFLSLATLKKPIVISIPEKSRRKFGVIGFLIFLSGVSIYTLPTVMQVVQPTPTPTVESSPIPLTEAPPKNVGEIGLGAVGADGNSAIVIFDNLIITEVP